MVNVISPIQHVVGSVFVHVSDLRRSAAWYSMVMGLPVLEERLNGGNVYWLALQGGTGLILDDNKSNTPADIPHVKFMYKTEDIEAARRFLEERGISDISEIDRPHPGLSFFRFEDPDRNSVMVTQSDYESEVVEREAGTESPILNQIGSVFLNVTDMKRAVRFHSEALGLAYSLEEIGSDDSIYSLQMRSGSDILIDNNRYRHGDTYETLFMLVSNDIEGARAYLVSRGVPVFTEIERYGDRLAFFTVKDPDDNVIMICSG
ncbi:VOC family protein [Paenibacillus sp. BC26]|uniref:VOC family protein n=1 Tax=Paenibacillus sp. BC26 TaxID=1881032 RepID=UPI0008E7AA8A|nr:VOC family protein [Paenibacillus sp. BC26]SFS56515.1 Glyoxalase/Bleomycin resistance protein/Dioxygenase superfamily protein [Paenibacillus sp. BC26]